MNEKLNDFYKKKFYFSYSSLNKILYSPKLFYDWYVLNQKEDRTDKHLLEGKVLHCLLVEEDKFKDKFKVIDFKLPSSNNKKIIEAMYKLYNDKKSNDLSDYDDEIIKWLHFAQLHQSLSTDEKRLAKIKTEDNIRYFQFLCDIKDKDLIDEEIYINMKEKVSCVKSCQKSSELLKLGDQSFELIEVFNEKPLSIEKFKDKKFGLKGIIDNFVIDHTTKTVYINDIKTTHKTLSDFPDSVEYYKYWLQASIYIELIKGNLRDNEKDYKIEFHFIVIDKNNNVYPFPVTIKKLRQWKLDMEEVINKAEYHYKNKEYKLPYEFANGDVVL
tara:strand:+ start:8276 stop:9259 length:984 start_codon:yes stop_codon:yes gene_type:complete